MGSTPTAGTVVDPDQVTAVIVTRGNVPLDEILDSLVFKRVIVWDNQTAGRDIGAFGRYVAAATYADTDYIYFQDDDYLMEEQAQLQLLQGYERGLLVANMPATRNTEYFQELVWGGWGSFIRRADVSRAFRIWREEGGETSSDDWYLIGCDIIFGVLNPWKRLNYDGFVSLHGADRPRTSAMQGDEERKNRFYYTAEKIAQKRVLERIWPT